MKTKNLSVCISILFLFSCLFITKVNALVEPTPEFYVNDYANILSTETENYIVEKSKELYKVDGTQIVVVTVSNLEGKSLEEYSLELARYFNIGSKDKNNGLLLLLALEERESRVEVGTGLEGILPDGKTGRFQDQYMIPFFKDNDFDTGIRNGYNAFFNEIVKLNNLNLETAKLKGTDFFSDVESIDTGQFSIFLFIGFIFGMVTRVFKKAKSKISKIYLIGCIILTIILFFLKSFYFLFGIISIIGFAMGRFGYFAPNIIAELFNRDNYDFSGGGSSHSSHSSSRSSSSSSSHSSGGGGSFSGGGSSRKF